LAAIQKIVISENKRLNIVGVVAKKDFMQMIVRFVVKKSDYFILG
jgi:hypothetical protein